MPKLLLVGIVEKTCTKTVIREIPGITDCFKNKEEKNGETIYKVCHIDFTLLLYLTSVLAHHQRLEHPWNLAIRLWR